MRTIKRLMLILGMVGCVLTSQATELRLTWTDNSNNEKGFRVWRILTGSGDNFVLVGSTDANVTTYTDTGLLPETDYSYRVTAWNEYGESEPSNIATGKTGKAGQSPQRPLELDAQTVGQISNMSMRALVGTGDGILIPGIIVTGGPVKVLVRAVGPTIGTPPFNVSGALADPVMQLVGGGSNDDWNTQAEGTSADVAAAADVVDAFPLPMGSKDAAMLVTLLPGAHTLHITGKDGAVGIVLVEVYKVP